MELDKVNPNSEIQQLLTLRDRITALSKEFEGTSSVQPRLDLIDLGNAFELIIEVPGVPQRNLEVAIQGTSIIIAGIRELHEEEHRILISERPRGHLQRTIDLPTEIAREASSAHLREGLLILHLPKA
jgi:HSP20 family protein